jgi:tetratricopeptide (TPR) repeat protein
MWPFSRKKKIEVAETRSGNILSKTGENFVSVYSTDFFGPYSESENGKFLIAWSDADREKGIGGFRESGEGSYILAEDTVVLISGRLQRPNDGKVANNGTFIINDWMFGEGLKGTFYAFDKLGNQLVQHRFTANLFNNGIAEDGRFAVCQCANSDTEDGGALAFFDFEKGILLWKIHPESGRAESYYFDCEKKELLLRCRERGEYRYSFAGQFIDKDKWEAERINYASAFELSLIAKERFKEKGTGLSEADAQEILLLLGRALKKGLDEYPNEKAAVYRTMGEVKESFGEISDAINAYELALELNPKVGIKRHLDILKKQKA